MKLLLLLIPLTLAACSGRISGSCPALIPYTPQVQAAAAAELRALPPGAVLGRMVEDYGDLRARIRAMCQ